MIVLCFQGLLSTQMWHLGQTEVSCLGRCPKFNSVLIEEGLYMHDCTVFPGVVKYTNVALGTDRSVLFREVS